MFEKILSEYSSYIRSRQLVKGAQVAHYTEWVGKFLVFASREKIKEFDVCLLRFLRELEVGHPDWQVGQASSRSTHRWTRPSTTSLPISVTSQDPAGAPGYRNTSMWWSRLLGSCARW